MDGKAVDRVVRDVVRPALCEAGFDAFNGRGAWRHHDQTVDLVVFRSFNAYIADGVGCTTFSFAVSAGVFYACMTDEVIPRPKDYELTFGFELVKSLRQPYFHPYGRQGSQDRPDVWYVLPDGSNLMECVVDALDAIKASGLPLIDRFTNPADAFQGLLAETSTSASFGNPGITMPGAPGSPRWRETTLAIGHLVTAHAESEIQKAPVLADRTR